MQEKPTDSSTSKSILTRHYIAKLMYFNLVKLTWDPLTGPEAIAAYMCLPQGKKQRRGHWRTVVSKYCHCLTIEYR